MSELIQAVDCLSREEVSRVLSCLDSSRYEPSTVFGDSGCEVRTDVRSNDRICLSDNEEASIIMHEGMNRALIEYRNQLSNVHTCYADYPTPGGYKTKCYREGIQILKYQPGQYYNWHFDCAVDRNVNEYHRTVSIVLYLSENFEGGRTKFHHRAFKPKMGQALVFPSNWCFPHTAEPVTSGEKIVAVTWYHSQYDFD